MRRIFTLAIPARAREKKLRLLALLPPGPESRLLQALAPEAGLCLTLSDALQDIVFRNQSDVPPIIVLDRQLFPDRWKTMVRMLTRNSPRPYVILLSPTTDANLWDEVQRVGGSDILRLPATRDDLLHALKRAGQLWRSQQQVHGPLSR